MGGRSGETTEENLSRISQLDAEPANVAKPSPLLAPICFVGGCLYGGAVRARNKLYDASLLPTRRLPHPVISVGNLTVGGSGKTPFVIHLVHTVLRLGRTPALLSRGYARAARFPVILEPQAGIDSPARALGDEPALVRRHESRIWLGISHRRHAAGEQISSRAGGLCFILDDGFQHRSLARDLDLVLIDRSQALEHNRMLPAGTLREPLSGLRRADVIVLNGPWRGPGPDPVEAFVRRVGPKAEIFHCEQNIERLVEFSNWRRRGTSTALPGSAFLVAAIGNPQRFHQAIGRLGVNIKGHRFFRDHTLLREDHWRSCIQAARAGSAEVIIITEKDAIKVEAPPGFPLLVAVQFTRLAEQDQLERRLNAIFGGYR